MKKMVLFPGVGYHCDKPLLYYARRLGEKYGFTVIPLSFHGFPSDIKGNLDKREEGYAIALKQAVESLKGEISAEDELVFVSKSIGTIAAMRYAKEEKLKPYQFLLTPLAETFTETEGLAGAVFHGTKDPLANTDEIRAGAERLALPLHLVQDANHSLETGDVQTDLKIQQFVMGELERVLFSMR